MAATGGLNQDEVHDTYNSSSENETDYQIGCDFEDAAAEHSSDTAWDDRFEHLSCTKNISVRLHRGRITECRVQGIVVSENTKLDPSHGLAKALFSIAGSSVWDDLKRQTEGRVQEPGTVLFTNGGALKNITHIIHIVTPVWANYENRTGKMECLYILQSAFFECVKRCVDKSLTSLALPAIGTGFCGIPARLCCLVYACALIKMDEYCHLKGITNLQIYFVDISKKILTAISNECNRAFSCGYDITAGQISNEVEKDLDIKSHIIQQKFLVKVYKGDICIFREGSIICAVNKDLTPSGIDTEEIVHKAGAAYQQMLQIHRQARKYKGGHVVETVAGDLSTHLVLHCIIPSKKISPIGRENHYREKLIACYKNAFQVASEQRKTVVALRVLGIDSGYLDMDLCCSALMDAMATLFESSDEMTSLKQLHVICREDNILYRIVTLLSKLSK